MGALKLKGIQSSAPISVYKSAAGMQLFDVNSPRAKNMPDALDDIIIAKMIEIDTEGFSSAYRFKNGNYLTGLAARALTELQVREKTGNNDGYMVEMIQKVGGGKRGWAWCMYEQQCAVGIAETLTGIKSDFPYSGSCAAVRKAAKKIPGMVVDFKDSVYGDVWIKVYPSTGLGHTGNFEVWIEKGVSAYLNEGNTTAGSEKPGGPVVREGGGSYRVARHIKKDNWVMCVRPFQVQVHGPAPVQPAPVPAPKPLPGAGNPGWLEFVEAVKRDDHPQVQREAFLAQCILESGRGSSELAKQHLNFCGMKYRAELAGLATKVDYKAHDGLDGYAKFANCDDSVDGYFAFIRRAPYKGYEQHLGSAERYIEFIWRQGYAESDNYVSKVVALLPEARRLLGAPAVSPVTPVQPAKKIRLCILVGHSKADGGASMAHKAFKNEYAYNSVTQAYMVERAHAAFPGVFEISVIYRDSIGRSGALAKARAFKPDVTIELHFNAANKKAVGTTTLCTREKIDLEFAQAIQAGVCKVFGRVGNSRGLSVLTAGGRGYTNVDGLPGSANCLVEPFFGDNTAEAEMAVAKHREYANALVDACAAYMLAKQGQTAA